MNLAFHSFICFSHQSVVQYMTETPAKGGGAMEYSFHWFIWFYQQAVVQYMAGKGVEQ
jgi:hypothetical protein